MLNSSSWLLNSPAFYNGIATQSLRYNDDDSPYLQRTFSGGDQQSWTWSGWVKRGSLGQQNLFGTEQDGSNIGRIEFRSDHKIKVNNKTGNTNGDECQTLAVYRDVSAWYHIVVSFDGSQSTQANRTKIYVNGILQDKQTDLSLSAGNGLINSNKQHAVGARGVNLNTHFDGYMAEVNFVDGQTLDETDFGEFKNGVWIAKAYTGSYGTNGYRLQFNQTGTGTASSSTIGADTSGNDNHFSSSGIVASDCAMPDSPENNFATWNGVSSFATDNSEGNLKASASSGNANSRTNSTIPISSGKWYFEVRLDDAGTNTTVGIAEQASPATYPGQLAGDYVQELDNARKGNNNSFTSYGTSLTTGDIFNCAVDLDNGEIYFGKNGTYFNSSDPATNTSPAFSSIPSGLYTIVTRPYSTATEAIIVSLNAGQDSTFAGATTAGGNADENDIGDFKYSVPSGFLALCTANLPQPTINIPTGFFNTVTYTGNSINSASTNAVTNVGHEPDFLWIKQIDTTRKHVVWNVAETPVYVSSDSNNIGSSVITDGVWNSTNGATYTANGGGFTVAEGDIVNANGGTFVAWSWHTVGNSGFSNNNGDINVIPQSKNVTAGISLGDYFGNGTSGETIAHGLNAAPEVIITKQRSGGGNSWSVFHKDVGTSGYLNLDNSNAIISSSENVQAVDATYYTVGNDGTVNQASSYFFNFVFHSVDGYSKFSSYTGNGSTDGTFVNTGFRPAWLMIKNTGVGSWVIQDTKRSPINPSKERIWADLEDGESSSTYDIDFLSNGFKHRNTHSDTNSSSTYIYMAFAEKPFKYANAR